MNWYEQSDVRDVMVKVRLIAARRARASGGLLTCDELTGASRARSLVSRR
jgi:hypothetical protein